MFKIITQRTSSYAPTFITARQWPQILSARNATVNLATKTCA